MDTMSRDKYLTRYELVLKIISVVFGMISFGTAIYFLVNFDEEKSIYLIVGLLLLFAMPFLIWLMYSLSMVLISFFYDVKMIRNRLKVMEERSRTIQKENSTDKRKSTSKQTPNQGNDEEQMKLDDSEIDDIIKILNQ